MKVINVRIVVPDTSKKIVTDRSTPSGKRVVETPYTAEHLCKLLYSAVVDVCGAVPITNIVPGTVVVDMNEAEYCGTADVRNALVRGK